MSIRNDLWNMLYHHNTYIPFYTSIYSMTGSCSSEDSAMHIFEASRRQYTTDRYAFRHLLVLHFDILSL